VQERVILDERIHLSLKDDEMVDIIPMVYRISSVDRSVSISRIRRALQAVVAKHSVLRTAIYLDTDGRLMQHCVNTDGIYDGQEHFGFTMCELSDSITVDAKLHEVLYNLTLLNLAKGRVIDCHIFRNQHCHDLSPDNDDLLSNDDWIIFSIHHTVFDGTSASLFFRDFTVAYDTDCALPVDENAFEYIDYSIHERLMDMTLSQQFWYSQLYGYNFERPMFLPVNRSYLLTKGRIRDACSLEIQFDQNVSIAFRTYASLHQVTPYQLALATFYAFLFKMTNGESDICFLCLDANRYRSELQDMIGMFVATLPFRMKLDPCWSFDELVKHVKEQCLSIREHTHYPLQQMLADFHLSQSSVGFLETYFEFNVSSSDADELTLCGTSLEDHSDDVLLDDAFYDLEVLFECDPASDSGGLSCIFSYALDIFDKTTADLMTRRFEHLYSQLFTTSSNDISIDKYVAPLRALSLILPEEIEEMQEIVFSRLSDVDNEGMFICLHSYFCMLHQD
jgi:hypothetical protein